MQLVKSRKGSERISAILMATLDLLSQEGYATLTLGSVARHVGMAKGHLQYYFPTRDSLLRSALDIQIEGLKSRWLQAASRNENDAWAILFSVVDEDIKICKSDINTALMLEKWAYAARDAEAQRMSRDWYNWIIDLHAEIVADLRPDLSPEDRYVLATLITSMLNGMWPFFGRSRIRKPGLDHLEQAFKESLATFITSFKRQSKRKPAKARGQQGTMK